MGWQIKRRVKTSDNSWANVSKSGVGASRKVGPRTTVNSKGRVSVRVAKGLTWRGKLF
jgi:hypothetical protein